MTHVGDDAAGFSVEFEPLTRTVRVRAWGFWDVETAQAFGPTVRGVCDSHLGSKSLVMDMQELKPMRDEGQMSITELIHALPDLGVVNSTVATANQLTRLQLRRLVSEAKMESVVQFPTTVA